MSGEDLAHIHLRCIERYAEIFEDREAEGQALCWWRWASTHLNRQLYEEVRKRRWARATDMEKRVAKEGVPSK